MITHGNLRSNAAALSLIWRFTASDVLLHALPLFHINGLFVATNVAMAAGASMRLMAGLNTDSVMAEMGGVTVMMGVQTFYTRLWEYKGLMQKMLADIVLFLSG